MADQPIKVAVAGRPHPEEAVSGDAWSVDWWAGACRLALIDGLGHGPLAAETARRAVEALTSHPELGPAEALTLCHRALVGSRGAAISIARIDPVADRLTYAGIGNVEAQLWRPGGSERPIAYRGIVGVTARTPRAFEVTLGAAWLLILWSDGVSARFDLAALGVGSQRDPQSIADALLRQWGRTSDDATVVVACPAR